MAEKQKGVEKNIKKHAEDNNMDIAELFFTAHKIGIVIGNFGWIYTPKVLLFHPIIILSWKLNKNRCLVTQLEYYFFGRTFMGDGPKFYVPRHQRYLLYSNFVLGSCYYLLRSKKLT